MEEKRPEPTSFVIKTSRGFRISRKHTTSLVANELLLEKIIGLRNEVNGTLLDIGSGTGPFYPVFKSKISNYISIDLVIKKQGYKPTINGDAHNLPFREKSLDTVLCTEVLEHCTHPFKVLKEIHRVLRPSGHAIISAPFMYRYHSDPEDYFRFTGQGFRYMIKESGLNLIKLDRVGGTIDFAVDFYTKVMIMILNRIGISKGIFKTVFIQFPQILYLHLRRNSFDDDIFTMGYVTLVKKGGGVGILKND